MTHTLQISRHDHLTELVASTAGRFGRRFRTIAWTEPDMGPVRSEVVARMRSRINSGEYRIDTQAVASAIVDRVCAGSHTITLH